MSITNFARFIRLSFILYILIHLCFQGGLFAQEKATITEEIQSIPTYPFSDPNPIPILGSNPKIYPYHKFEGYSHSAKPMDWKVVKLENDYIEVYVLPETGGKVYGAIEKASGEEFLYLNKVMKFRNISMRGPWTSGGIEFNFGIIGHHPSTASPVDYKLVENADGSVSCFVGTMDLPSRTHWRVEIRLQKDKAYFETRVLWYNPTPLHQSYYNWMTGAAHARPDLEFFTPGNTYLTHPGDPKSWPYDAEGRKIAYYRENNFGGSKSYHVVGEYNNYFGGYFHEREFGFGHWALYDEMPGQKLWIWALSRSGGIWEDLLTDTDGQYIEFQAGRLFDQYSPSGYRNPITQVPFYPNSADTWRELWFPVKQTGGISAVSEFAVMHLQKTDNQTRIIINALAHFETSWKAGVDGSTIKEGKLSMAPMEVDTIILEQGKGLVSFQAAEIDLDYTEDVTGRALKRPFEGKSPTEQHTASFHYFDGLEELEFRNFDKAVAAFEKSISLDPWHIEAMVKLGEIHFRNAEYDQALKSINQALSIDTYHPGANYIAGITYRAKEDYVNSLESLGWAARSTEYRSAAYSEMAQVSLRQGDLKRSYIYADKALFNEPLQMNALWTMALLNRLNGNQTEAEAFLKRILKADPLNHPAKVERYFLNQSEDHYKALTNEVQNEFPNETFLETAILYAEAGRFEEAIQVIMMGPNHMKNQLWLAWLLAQTDTKKGINQLNSAATMPVDFVFPYRRETLKVLDWAYQIKPGWKTGYLMALNLWGLNQREKADTYFTGLGTDPQIAPFYIARSDFLGGVPEDIARAYEIAPDIWRYHHLYIQSLWGQGKNQEALEMAKKASGKFPENYTIGFDLAKAHLRMKDYLSSVNQLNQLHILPFEGASEGRQIYEQALLFAGMEAIEKKQYREAEKHLLASLEWPERLGVGKPFDPDERLQIYMLGYVYQQRKKKKAAAAAFEKVISQTRDRKNQADFKHLLGLLSYTRTGNGRGADALLAEIDTHSPENQWVKLVWEGMEKEASIMLKGKIKQTGNPEVELIERLRRLE